ncbi:MAG: hypothetical protein C0524_02110 [Rhodobacter sp.]|nr:hypothetical protein [Rhodobacter sp.]
MTRRLALTVPVIAGAVAAAMWWRAASRAEGVALDERLAAPLAAPKGPMAVFHIGHSLVNRDMPAMLAQLAGEGHRYELQLGWGTTLKAHWGDDTINGFDIENANPRFRAAHEAVGSGEYDAIVLTEMVEIRDALRYFDSPVYLARWAEKALAARPDVRIYLYETWHQLDDSEGWLERLDADLQRYWLDGIAKPALAKLPASAQLRIIPAGQVLAAFVREVEARGGVGNVTQRTDLFARNPDGSQDQIHLNDLGNYLVALVHYAVLHHRSPVGLPYAMRRGDGTVADAPAQETARMMQETVLAVIRRLPITGVSI